jgi:hypothetical protein
MIGAEKMIGQYCLPELAFPLQPLTKRAKQIREKHQKPEGVPL